MAEKEVVDNDEINFVDVYEFFKDGWKTLAVFSCIGLLAGLITAYALPEKFQASALIDSASVVASSVEPVAVLAEKMKSPTYYSMQTIEACKLGETANAPKVLVDRPKPSVAKASPYVSLSYKAKSPAEATQCLDHVLKDVIQNQEKISKPLINNMEVALANAESELKANITERDQQRIKNREKLKVAKMKLVAAQDFVEKFSKDGLQFKFDDPQFSASALLLSTLMSKQNEIKELEIQISALEMEVAANLTDKDQRVRALTNRVTEMKNSLLPPATKPATFASPVYAPDVKVEPKRSVVTIAGLIAGGFLGLSLLVGLRIRNNLRKQIEEKKAFN